MQKIFRTYKENIFSVLLVTTIFVALFFTKVVAFFILLLFIVWITQFKKFQNFSSKWKWIWPFLGYSFVFGIAFFYADNSKEALKILERHTSFIVLPFLIFCKNWSSSEINFFGKFFVKIVLLISIISLIYLAYFFLTHIDFVNTMDDTYLQWKLPHLLGFHPTYLGLNIVIANIILLTSLKNTTTVFKDITFYLAVFLSFYLVYLSPRTPIMCQLIVWVWFIFNRISNDRKIKVNKIFFLIVPLLIVVFLSFTSEYLIDKLMKSVSDKRFLLWRPALSIIKENYFLMGEGLGNGDIQLTNYISEKNLTQFKIADLHNQYLMNFTDIGLFGVLAIFMMLFRPLIYLKNNALYLFSIIFFISMFTESILFVIKGIITFIIMSSFFILKASLPYSEENKYNS
jgi:O-antigen ligase